MALLLDTHIWLWYLLGSERLPPSARELITGASSDLWLSPISVWEASLLVQRRRLHLDRSFDAWLPLALQQLPIRDAPLTREVSRLPYGLPLPHRDPADRFLAATALTYGLTLVTVDQRLQEATWLRTAS
ncbi:MAG: type II toxin-antitoxin system VapC family toxin [Acidobacteriota bacterium]